MGFFGFFGVLVGSSFMIMWSGRVVILCEVSEFVGIVFVWVWLILVRWGDGGGECI